MPTVNRTRIAQHAPLHGAFISWVRMQKRPDFASQGQKILGPYILGIYSALCDAAAIC